MRKRVLTSMWAAAALTLAAGLHSAGAETVLRAKLDSGIKHIDPIWTTAYAARSHGFMVYDTLFGMDENFVVRPQMVETYNVSDNGFVYTFTLREGLRWHDGDPVTAEDCVASIERWGARDGMGQKLMEATDRLEVVDDRTFRLHLRRRYGLVFQSLAKITSNVPFMMKKEHAMTDPHEQITEVVGSGPFKFVAEEFVPGNKAVYVKNEDYVPRDEPASNTAGGKVPRVDRVEFVWIPDQTTAANALMAGEIDYIQDPPADLHPMLKQAKGVAVEIFDPLGNQPVLRINHQQPPFDNPKVRQAVLWAVSQEDALRAAVGNDPSMYQVCGAMFVCGTPLATDAGAKPMLSQNFERAQQLLKEAGYDGEPIVVMHVTDDFVIDAQTLVNAQALRKAGFNVEVQSMDWSTLVSRRSLKKPVSEGGWHIFQTWFNGPDFLNPVEHMPVNSSCGDAWFGWPCDDEIEKLRTAYTQTSDPQKQREIARRIQERAYEIVAYVPLGAYYQPVAFRADKLDGLIRSPVQLFWNVSKTE